MRLIFRNVQSLYIFSIHANFTQNCIKGMQSIIYALQEEHSLLTGPINSFIDLIRVY